MLTSKALVISVLVFVFAVLILFGSSMAKDCTHDEHMYCTAGVLMAAGKMVYRDFSYVSQLPYHPLLYAGIYKMLGTDQYLLVGRIVSIIADVMVAVLIFLIYLHVFGRLHNNTATFFGLIAVLLNIFNPFVNYSSGRAWNHDVIMLVRVVRIGASTLST